MWGTLGSVLVIERRETVVDEGFLMRNCRLGNSVGIWPKTFPDRREGLVVSKAVYLGKFTSDNIFYEGRSLDL